MELAEKQADRGVVSPILTRAEALAIVADLTPAIADRARSTDENRRVAAENIAALRESGLFDITVPQTMGGSELGFTAMVEVAEAIAASCGSTGWVYGVLTGHNWMVSLFPPAAQQEVFTKPGTLTASVFRLAGKTVAVEGGFRLTGGEGRFCSGVDFSDWVVVGNAVERPDGVQEPRFLLIPMKDVEIVDDWFTVGMRGTGSRSIRIKDAFIPEHRSVLVSDLGKGTTPGARYHFHSPIYATPFPVALPFSLVAAPLGMARGALNAMVKALAKKFGAMEPEQMGEQGAVYERIARASAQIDSARALVLRDAAFVETGNHANLSPLERTRIHRNLAYAAQQCRQAVSSLFEAGGGSGIYDGSEVQRFWRDVNASTCHVAFNWDEASVAYGRTLLGLHPSRFGSQRR